MKPLQTASYVEALQNVNEIRLKLIEICNTMIRHEDTIEALK